MGVWGCHGGQAKVGQADGGHHGFSPVYGTPYVMSVGHEGNHFKIWKFYFICKKGH